MDFIKSLLKSPIVVFLLCSFFTFSAWAKPVKWIVYYGSSLQKQDLDTLEFAVLDPDLMDARPFAQSSCKKIAYLSLGEAEDYRSYWPLVKEKPFLVEANPDWKGAHRIDVRSPEWRAIVLNALLPKIRERGYDGVFLDTIDTARYLEEKDPQKYAGSEKAMVELIDAIRKEDSRFLIYTNNGLEILDEIGDRIDAAVVEDLYTRYDFQKKKSFRTPAADTLYKEKILDDFRARTQKPVYTILYEKSIRSALARYGIAKANKKGYGWYLTTVDLKTIGHHP